MINSLLNYYQMLQRKGFLKILRNHVEQQDQCHHKDCQVIKIHSQSIAIVCFLSMIFVIYCHYVVGFQRSLNCDSDRVNLETTQGMIQC